MSLLKYIYRLKRMDDLIHRKATGTAEEFASALGISVSVLKENINDMRALNVDIQFDRTRKTYFYKTNSRLLIKLESYKVDALDAAEIKGGMGYRPYAFRTVLPDGGCIHLPLQ